MSEKKLPCPVKGGADFTPNLGHYSGIRPFRAWVQMVLPQVYNDALSYQELVYKLLWYINTLLEDVNTCEEDIGKLKEAFEQLQCYVNMYFHNLDMEAIIDARLDAMAERGELASVLMKYIEAGSGIEIDVTTETKTKEIPIPCYCKVCPLDKSCCPSCKWYNKETGEFATTETIEYEVSKMNIHTDLVEGDGITITPESSTKSGAQTISANIDVGTGLNTEVDEDGKIVITTDVGDVTAGLGIRVATLNGNTKKVYTNLIAGDGITLYPASGSRDSGEQTISLNLASGEGTYIEENTDGSVSVMSAITTGTGISVQAESGANHIYSNFKAGDGIKINPASSISGGTQTFSTNLEAGSGVSISTDSTGKQTISANLKNGGGIIINNEDDGSISIGTTSGGSLKSTLKRGTDFVASIPGIIYPVAGTSASVYRDYAHYTSIVESDIAYPAVYGTISKDSEGNVTGITVQIGNRSYLAAGNMADSDAFQFRHSYEATEVPCNVLDIYFIGDYAELSNPSSTVSVTNPSSLVWNVEGVNDGSTELTADNIDSLAPMGASWSVSVNVRNYTDSNNIKHYLLAATSIADGFNSQYLHWGNYLYGYWLNVGSCTLEMTT